MKPVTEHSGERHNVLALGGRHKARFAREVVLIEGQHIPDKREHLEQDISKACYIEVTPVRKYTLYECNEARPKRVEIAVRVVEIAGEQCHVRLNRDKAT